MSKPDLTTAVATACAADAERTLFKVTQLTKRWSLGRTKIYELLEAGTVRSVKIGGSRRVPRDAVEEFEATLAAQGTV